MYFNNYLFIYFSTASALGAQVVGEQPSVMEICLIMLNNQGNFIPDSKNFDFSICVRIIFIYFSREFLFSRAFKKI